MIEVGQGGVKAGNGVGVAAGVDSLPDGCLDSETVESIDRRPCSAIG